MSEANIKEWVEFALKNEDIFDYTITIEGKSAKGDGYLGNIFFVKVIGQDKQNQNQTVNLVIKASKESENLRRQIPIKEAFVQEIFVYKHILKEFDILQKEIEVDNLLTFLPHCYASRISNSAELLVLEDLRTKGYKFWDRKVPMTQKHVKLILEAYGKWHAFSFALRKKKSDIFQDLVKDNINVFSYFFVKAGLVDLALEHFTQATDACISKNEVELLNQVQFTNSDAKYNFTGLLSEDPDYRVITHGDCWNNNFLFNFDKDVTKPLSVMVLDWQCAGLSSPVFDLSHFIYSCVDTATSTNVTPLLKTYYKSLGTTLELLGCSPEELFPYSKLVQHWKRFSRYGLLLQPFILKFSMCDVDDIPDFAEAADQGKEFLDNFKVDISNKEDYYKRVRANLVHYVESLKIPEEN